MKTSGLSFTLNPDGSAEIGYEDYDVKIFDGADYEVMYILMKIILNYYLILSVYQKKMI